MVEIGGIRQDEASRRWKQRVTCTVKDTAVMEVSAVPETEMKPVEERFEEGLNAETSSDESLTTTYSN